jgi:uncharacterized repeat protein (TIGR01451 family)
MKRLVFFLSILSISLIIFPVVEAIIEEDLGNYTRIDEAKRDDSGINVTLSQLRKSYTSVQKNYTVTARDFDAQGTVVLDVNFMGKQETVILRGEWNANRTKIIFTPPAELFNKTMIITPLKIVPPEGIFTCCPEAKINIDLIRPELFLEFNEDKKSITYKYESVDPYANWSYDPKSSPFNETTEDSEFITYVEKFNAYRIHEQIPVEVNVTNFGDAESQDNWVYIDTDGLIIEDGMPYYQLPNLAGEEQKNAFESSSYNRTMKLRFPYPPDKFSYTIYGYVRGKKEGITYYYDATKVITLLPTVNLQKYATKETLLISRQEVEKIYHSIDADKISRWLQSGEVFVTIGVSNYGNYEIKGLKLTDSVGEEFSVDNRSMNWTFDLKPLEIKEFKYRVKALGPGKIKHTSAQLIYSDINRTWNLISSTPSTEVHGPCIQVYKKPDNPVIPPGSNVMMTITIRNSGDMPSRVRINDSLPENSTFINGSTNYEGVLMPKDSVIISYNISIEAEGQIQLPAPDTLINGREDSGCGEPILGKLMVREPAPPTPVKTIGPVETPAGNLTTPFIQRYRFLEGLILALMLILAVAVLIILHRTNE